MYCHGLPVLCTLFIKTPSRCSNFVSKLCLRDLAIYDRHTFTKLTDNPPVSVHANTALTDYPTPRSTLNNIIAMVDKELKNPGKNMLLSFRPVGVKSVSSWSCTCHMHWPAAASFSATAKTKAEAARLVSVKALHWLALQGKLKNMKPVFFEKEDIKALKKTDVHIVLSEEKKSLVDRLFYSYNEKIKDEIQKVNDLPAITNEEDVYEIQQIASEASRIFTVNNRNNLLRDRTLFQDSHPHLSDVNSLRRKLPIFQFRQAILDTINKNRVLVIKGEPGCGKSTQVPQYLMEEAASNGQACECNMIVTQPRRISAIALAERVAAERGEEVGDVVGYQVRFKSRLPRPPGAGIRFCSSGILLRILQSNPGLAGISHIILDEAHERDVNTDMLMLLLKRVLSVNANLKLIVMSATINPEIFQRYYPGAVSLSIPGFTHPVKSYYLEDIRDVNLRLTQNSLEQNSPRLFYEEIAAAIHSISMKKPAGAILCFLPGWQDIKQVSHYLERKLDPNTNCVLPLHSRLSFDDQKKVFSHLPPGVRKIILSTNVAETSVTIDDVSYVVDTGIHKEERLASDKATSMLDNSWVSQANVIQRRGRAGRVGPGECFHLYTLDKFHSLPTYPVPELHRVPLQKVVLDIKAYNEEEKAVAFLSDMPEPPTDEAVMHAVDELIELGALNTDETLTTLGRRISKFTTHPKLSKALVHAAILCCLDPVLTICSVLSADADMFSNSLEERSAILDIKKEYSPWSDHLAALDIYNEWRRINGNRDREGEELFCIRNMLRKNTMRLIMRMRQQSMEQLVEAKMVPENYENNYSEESISVSHEFVKAVLFSGFSSHLFRRTWDMKNGRIKLNSPTLITETGSKAVLMSDCVCHKQAQVPSPFLTYFRRQESQVRRASVIRDASVIEPLSLSLFSASKLSKIVDRTNLEENSDTVVITNSKKLPYRILANRRDAETIENLKTMLNDVIIYYLNTEGRMKDEVYDQITQFKEELITTISSLLNQTNNPTNLSLPIK